MKNDVFKYAAFALMGIYFLNKTKSQGMGEDYRVLSQKTQKIADLISQKINHPQKELLSKAIKEFSQRLVDEHMNVRTLK